MKILLAVPLCVLCAIGIANAAANLKNLDRAMRLMCSIQYRDEICDVFYFKNITDVQNPYCKDGQCAGVKYEVIEKLYNGLLYTREEIEVLNKKSGNPNDISRRDIHWAPILDIPRFRNKRHFSDEDHDGDKCCRTRQYFNVPGVVLMNIDGVNRTVVHMPDRVPEPLFQIIHTGKCFSDDCSGCQTCSNCQLENKVTSLLVIDPDATCWPPLMFDYFSAGSYCSCKSLK